MHRFLNPDSWFLNPDSWFLNPVYVVFKSRAVMALFHKKEGQCCLKSARFG